MFDSCVGTSYDRSKGVILSIGLQSPPVDTSMAPTNTSSSGRPPRAPKYKTMRETDKVRIVSALNSMVNQGTFGRGSISSMAREMGYDRSTISKLWNGARVTRATGVIHSPEISRKLDRRGRRPKLSPSTIRVKVKALPLNARNTRQNLSFALRVSHTTVNSWVKKGILRTHRNMLKPTLTEQNKLSRLLMATSFVKEKDNKPGEYEYEDMLDLVHIDEKWFYLSQDGKRFVLADDEENPHRTVKHKSHITKVMFLCAVARPRFIPHLNKWWDGKIGIWPIGEWVPAKRDSANRPKGTPVWKNTSITRDVYRSLLVETVLPGIMERWPVEDRKERVIRIQQDGAKSHISERDPEFLEFLKDLKNDGQLDATLYTQSPNSPDTNICDLGFFRAIQSASLIVGSNEKALIDAVTKAFNEYPKEKLNRTWLTLQSCFNMIIEEDGGNDYKIPHMNKEGLERIGQLPTVLDVTEAFTANNNLHLLE